MYPKVSVIIIIYNVEKYLEECIDSVLNQNYKAIEIILVDDGSTDKSSEIADDYARKHETITCIHKTNGGIASARNIGLENAKGKYLMFVDADDILDGSEAVESLVEIAEKHSADITTGEFKRFSDDGSIGPIVKLNMNSDEDSSLASFRFKAFYSSGHISYSWGKIFRKDFLLDNNLYVEELRFPEDKLYSLECYLYKPKYAFLEQSVYLYRQQDQSATFKYKEDLGVQWHQLVTKLEKFSEERGIKADDDIYSFHILWGGIFVVKEEITAKKKSKEIRKCLSEYLDCNSIDRISLIQKKKMWKTPDSISIKIAVYVFSGLLSHKLYYLFITLMRIYYRM